MGHRRGLVAKPSRHKKKERVIPELEKLWLYQTKVQSLAILGCFPHPYSLIMSSFEIANYVNLDALPRIRTEAAKINPRASDCQSVVEDKALMKPIVSSTVRVGILSVDVDVNLQQDNAIAMEGIAVAIAEINQNGGILGQAIEAIEAPEIGDRETLQQQARILLEDATVKTIFSWGIPEGLRQELFSLVEASNTLLWYADRNPGAETFSRIFYTGTCPNQRVEAAIAWLQATGKQKCYLINSSDLLSQQIGAIFAQQWQDSGQQQGELAIATVDENTNWEQLLVAISREEPDLIINTCGAESYYLYETDLVYESSGLETKPLREKTTILALNLTLTDIENLGESKAGHYFLNAYFPHSEAIAPLSPPTKLRRQPTPKYTFGNKQ
ncbi:transporter substrate-binding protein [Spirulina sp. 06S082]|uniref:transporter substrate-binding protein n=1 Tax=Spirulina sp. 06S082 TaxID=3110248 RepID=UPI002B218AB2|nr:transporter substrate-binding protein [Spirulina sp. 06S082]MEA5468038.1 transporter substrate-binding protein [Spirulina sp. 06S082]